MLGRSVYLAILFLLDSVRSDWVEIPFLQPSTTTTQKSIVIRKNTNHPSFIADSNFMSHVLLPASSDRDAAQSDEDEYEQEEPSLLVNHATLSPVRISNLVDFDEFVRSSTTTEGPISSLADRYPDFQKRFYEYPRTNVSANLGWTSANNAVQFVTANHHRPSPMEPDRQPISNKYHEESIEHSQQPVQTIHDRVELPDGQSSEEVDSADDSSSEEEDLNEPAPETSEKPSDRFNDFDDYDEQRPDVAASVRNVTIIKRRRRPGSPGRVTIVKVIPPRRRLRPVNAANEGGLSGFVSFLKQMQDQFMQRTAKNIGDKIKVLQELKDQLLLNIERRMSTLWRDPPDADKSNRRVKRGGGWMEYSDHGHGGMDFPSAEAALLTISFLTFAVFLIKLVLQVINTIKAKHYTYNTLTGLNGVNAATLKIVNRSKRDVNAAVQDELWKDDLNILSAINDFKYT